MKINKQTQYAILFALYLDRAGRATVDTAATNLNISELFLHQVARKLRLAGVIKSIRGPNGGFELIGEPVVYDIIMAMAPMELLGKDTAAYRYGGTEQRAVFRLVASLNNSITYALARTVKNVNEDLVEVEMKAFNKQYSSAAN